MNKKAFHSFLSFTIHSQISEYFLRVPLFIQYLNIRDQKSFLHLTMIMIFPQNNILEKQSELHKYMEIFILLFLMKEIFYRKHKTMFFRYPNLD